MEGKVMAHTSYRDMIVETLLEKYDMIDWEKSMDSMLTELVANIKGYKILISCAREGYFLQVFNGDNDLVGHTLSEKECPKIKELFKKVHDYIVEVKEDKFWQKICDLFNEG